MIPVIRPGREVFPVSAPGRLRGGLYRIHRLAEPSKWVIYNPRLARPEAIARWSDSASRSFQRVAIAVIKEFGRACRECGYLEFEHNIDGEEKAPCGGFE